MQRPRVCIIGGGVAGLSCARHLIEKNVADVTVFEAMDRLGGRVHTMYFEEVEGEPYKLELGANWIHGCVGNPVFKIAKEHHLFEKIPCKTKPTNRKEIVTLRENRDIVDASTVRYVSGVYRDLCDQCDEFYETSLPPGYHKDASVEEFMRKESTKQFKEKHKHKPDVVKIHEELFNSHLKFETSITGCHSMTEVSLKQFGSYKELGGGDPTINQGFSKVIEVIAKEIPSKNIRLNSPVLSVSWKCDFSMKKNGSLLTCCTSPKGGATTTSSAHNASQGIVSRNQQGKVKVKLADCSEHFYDHVIVTCSLGYLKHNHKTLFEPRLPQEKVTAIKKLGYGAVDKVYLVFKDLTFLPQKFLRLTVCWSTDTQKMCKEVPDWVRKIALFGTVNTPHDNTLIAWITGQEAEEMESLSEEEVGLGCVTALRTVLRKDDIPLPQKVIRTKWSEEPFIRGSYSFIAVGSTVEDMESLAEPICGTTGKPIVQFAGEATDSEHYSTTHGAYLSGEREANRLRSYYHKQNVG